MNRIRLIALLVVFAAIASAALGQADKFRTSWSRQESSVIESSTSATSSNLQTAFYAESSASALYGQFAAKADSEGYGQLASLISAIARGEDIHSLNCVGLIKEMGATPTAQEEPVLVLTTAEES